MGMALLRLAAGQPEQFAVVAAVTRKSPPQRVVAGVPHFAANELPAAPEFDVAIDFSLPEGFDPILSLCVDRGAALVSGTTGLSDVQRAALQQAASRIPLVWASNFSLGVAVLADLVERAASALKEWDCDIVESHHTQKKDAPSGTALTLGQAAASVGIEVRYASLRAGDIVGEHTVQFTGLGERIELTHRATNRDIFARGALQAALRLRHCAPGLYGMRDLLFAD
jgi:4-hydroxy-tetrahydrodipicolinate reductase